MEPIRIFIVDDDRDWLSIIVNILKREPDISVAGTALSQAEALFSIGKLDVDVVLLDLNLSGERYDGLMTALDIFKVKPVKIMMTSFQDEDRISRVMKSYEVSFINNRNYHEFARKIREEFHRHSPVWEMQERFQGLYGELRRND